MLKTKEGVMVSEWEVIFLGRFCLNNKNITNLFLVWVCQQLNKLKGLTIGQN